MKDGAIGQRAEGTNPLKGEPPTLENFGGGSVQGEGGGRGGGRWGGARITISRRTKSASQVLLDHLSKRKWEKIVQRNLLKTSSHPLNSIHPFSISSCNISVCSGMQVNNDSKDNLMLNQEMIICFTMVPLSCQKKISGRKKNIFLLIVLHNLDKLSSWPQANLLVIHLVLERKTRFNWWKHHPEVLVAILKPN